MPAKPKLLLPDEQVKQFQNLLMVFDSSLSALSLQDLASIEKANLTARNISNVITPSLHPDDLVQVNLRVSFIEAATRLLRATMYSIDERIKKAIEELEAGQKLCLELNQSIIKLRAISSTNPALKDMTDFFGFLFVYFDKTFTSMYEISIASLARIEFRYVDEVQVFRDAAAEMKSINDYDFGLLSDANSNIILSMGAQMTRLGASFEQRAERMEEARKKIQFLPPIDKRVFIVHGHNEPALRELESILVSFGLDPIILKDEVDNGKTLIEKFEHYGRVSAFAFVFATPDDWVENKKVKYFQARPNVLFELGWFAGRYGRDKVRILVQKKTPLPSDLLGLVTIDFENNVSEAIKIIRSDLEQAGIPIVETKPPGKNTKKPAIKNSVKKGSK